MSFRPPVPRPKPTTAPGQPLPRAKRKPGPALTAKTAPARPAKPCK